MASDGKIDMSMRIGLNTPAKPMKAKFASMKALAQGFGPEHK
jgi:hypothetical protein